MNQIYKNGVLNKYKPFSQPQFQTHNPNVRFIKLALVVGLWVIGVVLVHLVLRVNGY